MTKQEYMQAFHDTYKIIIGRNNYSQSLRSYVFTKHSNGCYYSDCSSSVAATYKKIGLPIQYGSTTLPNTVGLYKSGDLVDVPVQIKNGVIQNPDILQVGDMLLFAGTDTSRASAGYVGHVEAVYAINAATKVITICGHGSAKPRTTEMNAYCKSRYSKKTSTKLGHKGLIKVRRHKELTGVEPVPESPAISGLVVKTLRRGDTGSFVVTLQKQLMEAGYALPKYGADGDFGKETEAAVKAFQTANGLVADGIADVATQEMLEYKNAGSIRIIGGTVNIRSAPGTNGQILGVAKHYDLLPYQGVTQVVSGTIWYLVEYENGNAWVSSRYAERI